MIAGRKTGPVRPATLADVSRAAGVSASAVSMVLTGRGAARISKQTQRRILAAAKRLAYRPNLLARGLANQRLRTLGVATLMQAGELSYDFLEILNGILTSANRYGQNTSILSLRDWNCDSGGLRRFCDGRIDGLILVAPTLDSTLSTLPDHFPIVAIHPPRALPGIVNIECDEEEGAFALVRYLVAQGHRRILHLTGPAGHIGSGRRFRGYLRALASARLSFDRELVATSGFSADLGRAAMRAWLGRHARNPPHAVFCVSDAAAIGCLEALTEAGLRVPDDVSIAGFGDSPAARSIIPPLTSVGWPLAEMGRRAVELLLTRVEAPVGTQNPLPTSVAYPAELIFRASVGMRPSVGGGRSSPGSMMRMPISYPATCLPRAAAPVRAAGSDSGSANHCPTAISA